MARPHSKPSSRSDRGGGKGKPRAVGSLYSKDTKPYRYGTTRSDNPILPEGFKEPSAKELKNYTRPLNQIEGEE